jgi:hypothetical protein
MLREDFSRSVGEDTAEGSDALPVLATRGSEFATALAVALTPMERALTPWIAELESPIFRATLTNFDADPDLA